MARATAARGAAAGEGPPAGGEAADRPDRQGYQFGDLSRAVLARATRHGSGSDEAPPAAAASEPGAANAGGPSLAARAQLSRMQVPSASLAAQDQLLSGADRRLVQTLASVQEVGQAVSQAGARAQESVEQAGARAWESVEQARESAKQTGSAVADGAQAAGLAVSAGVQSAVPAVRDVSKKVVTGAAEVHQDIVQAHGDGGTSAAAERTAVHAAKAAIGAYAGYVGATAAAKTKAAEVGMIASHYVHDSVSEGTQQKLQEGASRALQGAKYLADVVATHGESAVKQGYASYVQASEIITAATEEAYAGLPEEKRQAILDKRRRVDDSKEHIKELGMTLARPLWKSVSASAGSALRDSVLSDPDMWPCVRRLCGPLMEELWHDIDEEILKGVELSIYKDPPPQDDGPRVGPLLRLRAFVLHHFLPHDRSIFGMLKDPVYLIFLAITFVPFWSARVGFYTLILLLLWAAPDGVDEYQLTSFVLSAKGMQFLTSGVVNNAYGAADYYIALHVCDGDQDCILRHTPGQNTSRRLPGDRLLRQRLPRVGGVLAAAPQHGARPPVSQGRGAPAEEARADQPGDERQGGGRRDPGAGRETPRRAALGPHEFRRLLPGAAGPALRRRQLPHEPLLVPRGVLPAVLPLLLLLPAGLPAAPPEGKRAALAGNCSPSAFHYSQSAYSQT
ncbi:unnamed protein product, partial [Prorocentrum cordatum]